MWSPNLDVIEAFYFTKQSTDEQVFISRISERPRRLGAPLLCHGLRV
jgi:hypothetical protein